MGIRQLSRFNMMACKAFGLFLVILAALTMDVEGFPNGEGVNYGGGFAGTRNNFGGASYGSSGGCGGWQQCGRNRRSMDTDDSIIMKYLFPAAKNEKEGS